MRISLISQTDYVITITPHETRAVEYFLETEIPARAQKKAPPKPHIAYDKAAYETMWQRLELMPPPLVEQIIRSGDVTPDCYEQNEVNETAIPVYSHLELATIALDKGLTALRSRERVEEVVHQRTITETYYEFIAAPLALPDYTQENHHE